MRQTCAVHCARQMNVARTPVTVARASVCTTVRLLLSPWPSTVWASLSQLSGGTSALGGRRHRAPAVMIEMVAAGKAPGFGQSGSVDLEADFWRDGIRMATQHQHRRFARFVPAAIGAALFLIM